MRSLVTRIHGRYYDVGEFDHPGGCPAIECARDRDATALFESYHALNRARPIKTLARYEVTREQADDYFHSRAFVSQVGSAASDQSRPLDDRRTYIERVEALEDACKAAGAVPRPPYWTGFTLDPQAIEFWLDRPNRLHDRRRFTRSVEGWTSRLLYP